MSKKSVEENSFKDVEIILSMMEMVVNKFISLTNGSLIHGSVYTLTYPHFIALMSKIKVRV